MDRTVSAVCAGLLVPLGLVVGCGQKPPPAPPASAPLVLAELQAASPGPWRRGHREPIAMTSLERSGNVTPAPPTPLNGIDADELPIRWDPRLIPPPTEQVPHDADSPPPRAAEPSLPAAPIKPPGPAQPAPDGKPGAAQVIPSPGTLERIPPSVAIPVSAVPQEAGESVALPWANPPAQSPEMVPVLQEADKHVGQGIRLAERGALYLARAEFVAALELMAQANDVQQNSRFYGDALAAGLTALEESHDFVQNRSLGKPFDLARVVGGHKTPILKSATLERLAPMVAAQRYYTYAQEQLAAAAGLEASGSQALFGLAKTTIAIGQSTSAPGLEIRGQATALYQAAFMADGRNFRAANELGVMLARNGDWVRARDLILHSVSLSPHPATHRNLAMVYRKLGQTQLAEQAQAAADEMERAGFRRAGPAVQWVDPATFASLAPASDSVLPPVAQPSAIPAAGTASERRERPVSTAKRSISDWLPWNVRR
jgi:tetratricopeptide (TPR) repeat protein